MPIDISREEYEDPSDVQTAPIPRSQIGTVISSYEKTIGICFLSITVEPWLLSIQGIEFKPELGQHSLRKNVENSVKPQSINQTLVNMLFLLLI